MHSSIRPSARGLAEVQLLGDDHPLDPLLLGDAGDVVDRAEPRQRGRRPRLGVGRGEVAGELQARLGVGGDPPRDPVGDVAGADHEADRDAGQALPGEADRGAQR